MTAPRLFPRSGLALAFPDRGSGPPLLLQHGLCGSAAAIAELAAAIPGRRLLTLDCRGHGASPPPADPADIAIATFADDLIALIEATGLQPLPIGGVSMGAAIACRIAVRRPDLVSALVLVRPAWVAGAAPDNMRPNLEVGRLIADFGRDEGRRRFLASATAARLADAAPDNRASLVGFFDRAPLPVTADLLIRISLDGPGITEADLAALRLPTLVIGTGRDEIHPLAHAERLAGLIPGARLVVAPPRVDDRARHFAESGVAIAAFLSALSPAVPPQGPARS